MKYKYSWSKRHAADAQKVGEWLYSLPNRDEETVVEQSRDKKSPAHEIIWGANAQEAEREYRLLRARVLLNSIKVEIVNSNKKVERINAFIKSADMSSYVVTLEACEEDLSAAELRCLTHMRQFKARWSGLQMVRDVVHAMNEVERRTMRKRKAKAA